MKKQEASLCFRSSCHRSSCKLQSTPTEHQPSSSTEQTMNPPYSATTDPAAYLAYMRAQHAAKLNYAHQTNAQSAAAVAAAAGQPQQPAPPAEDAVQDGGDAIDTFSSYIPTALPRCIVEVLRDQANGAHEHVQTNASDAKPAATVPEIIELSDSEDELEIVADSSNNNFIKSDATNESSTTHQTNNDSDTTNDPTESIAHTKDIFNKLQSHTSPAVESALLSSVSAPPVSNSSADVVLPLVKQGKLSPLQAEGVCLAVERFRRVFLGEGKRERAGESFVVDGCVVLFVLDRCIVRFTYDFI